MENLYEALKEKAKTADDRIDIALANWAAGWVARHRREMERKTERGVYCLDVSASGVCLMAATEAGLARPANNNPPDCHVIDRVFFALVEAFHVVGFPKDALKMTLTDSGFRDRIIVSWAKP